MRGKPFQVLKRRRVAGVPTLILRNPGSRTFAVAEEWTDWGSFSPCGKAPTLLDPQLLLRLVELIDLVRDTAVRES
jgi:Family of unknown function (DUF5372)